MLDLTPRKTLAQALLEAKRKELPSSITGSTFYSKPEHLIVDEWQRVLKMREEEHPLVKGWNHIDNRIARENLKVGDVRRQVAHHKKKRKPRQPGEPNVVQNGIAHK